VYMYDSKAYSLRNGTVARKLTAHGSTRHSMVLGSSHQNPAVHDTRYMTVKRLHDRIQVYNTQRTQPNGYAYCSRMHILYSYMYRRRHRTSRTARMSALSPQHLHAGSAATAPDAPTACAHITQGDHKL
jgi:hypothetical protein